MMNIELKKEKKKKKKKKGKKKKGSSKTNGKAKGVRVEREFVQFLTDLGLLSARRSSQYSAKLEGDPDIFCDELSKFHLEVKGRQDNGIYFWLEQAKLDSRGETTPMVAIKRNNKPWIVTMLAEDWVRLALSFNQEKPNEPSTESGEVES